MGGRGSSEGLGSWGGERDSAKVWEGAGLGGG